MSTEPQKTLELKVQALPDKPGVYLMRDRQGQVIYVGKAVSLRNRVRNYFRRSTLRRSDPKIRSLIKSIVDFDVIVLRNEAEAILTEGRLIKEYKPRYNTAFKDDKRFLMLAIDLEAPWPRFEYCRLRKNDRRTYLGPYASSTGARAARDFVEKRYGLRQCRAHLPGEQEHKHCMADIIRHCSAPCIGKIIRQAYLERAQEACAFLRGERPEVLGEIRAAMEAASTKLDFEKAATLRDMLLMIQRVVKQRASGLKTLDIKKEEALAGLETLRDALQLAAIPRVIETFDISNISGTNATASMVVAVNGVPDPRRYKRFMIKSVQGIDDPAMMREAVGRHYARVVKEGRGLPGLVVVDGGITQLRAGRAALDELGLYELRVIGLAKQREEIYWDVSNEQVPLQFPHSSPALKVLQQIRDEAHRFALAYHRSLRGRRIRESILDDIPGFGRKKKALVLAHFGSVERLRKATREELIAVTGIGETMAALLLSHLHGTDASRDAEKEVPR